MNYVNDRRDELMEQARKAIAEMQLALYREQDFDPTGIPEIVAGKMKRDIATQYVTACLVAGKLLADLMEVIDSDAPKDFTLTSKELERAQVWVTNDYSFAKYAQLLEISELTLRRQLQQIYRKCGVHTKHDLARVLRDKGWIR